MRRSKKTLPKTQVADCGCGPECTCSPCTCGPGCSCHQAKRAKK